MSDPHSQWEETARMLWMPQDNFHIEQSAESHADPHWIINYTGCSECVTTKFAQLTQSKWVTCWYHARYEIMRQSSQLARRKCHRFTAVSVCWYTLCRLSWNGSEGYRYLFCITDGQVNGLQRFRENRQVSGKLFLLYTANLWTHVTHTLANQPWKKYISQRSLWHHKYYSMTHIHNITICILSN